MNLVWKLLRQHISKPQLAGFFFANLLGMLIVLLSLQFYNDVVPVFTQGDSFIKKEFLIVSKRISVAHSFSSSATAFKEQEIKDLQAQRFTKSVGTFNSSQYHVDASMGLAGTPALRTELFFESVPDEFVDTDLSQWKFDSEHGVIPIILPKNYLTIYNFGFAQSRSLPKMSEGLIGAIDLMIHIKGNGKEAYYKGKVIGFSTRLNTILVPESFLVWSNQEYAPEANNAPSRLIVEVKNPTDDAIATYFKKKNYETDDDKLDAGKTTFFLKVVSGIIMSVGLLISALSFYILMLSIYLLVEKNTHKLENLLLIGYTPQRVSFPYQALTVGMNVLVLVLSLLLLFWIRGYYMDMLYQIFPQMKEGSMWPAYALGGVLLVIVSTINVWAVHRKVIAIWYRKGVRL